MALTKYNFFENFFKNIVVFLELFFNKLYDVVIEVNPNQYIWMKNCGILKNKIKYVPNGIPKDTFDNVNPSKFIKKYNLKNKFVISYLGRVQDYKGIDQVIKVIPRLDKKIVFLIMGKDVGHKKLLVNLAKKLNVNDRIIFTGEVSYPEKLVGLDVSEIFVLPSNWEAFGIVILEAMARGNAIISTKTEGGEFLVKKENGFVYDFGDLKNLEKYINLLFKNNDIRKKMKKNNIKKSKEFLWENISYDLEALYTETIK